MPTGSLAASYRAAVIAATVAGIALACYLPTLAPDLTWRAGGADGGDLIAAAAQGGIAHPSGYPTYTLLAALALRLPWGAPAWRVHLLSAGAAAVAAGLVAAAAWHLITRYQGRDKARPGVGIGSALLAGVSLAAAPLLWSQATIAEVYTLLAALTAGLVLLTLLAGARLAAGQDAWGLLLALAFLSGLALTHHLTILLVLPFLWGYVAWKGRVQFWILDFGFWIRSGKGDAPSKIQNSRDGSRGHALMRRCRRISPPPLSARARRAGGHERLGAPGDT